MARILLLLAGGLPSWEEDAVALRAKLSTMIDNIESHRNSDPAPDAAQSAAEDPASANESPPALASLEQRVAALEAEKTELDNYKRRLRNEMSEHETKARETILCDFLEVADNLERAIASWKEGGERDVKSVRNGVELVLRLFKAKLERYAVTPIEAKGQPFDPHVHHAVSQAPSAEATPGTVLHELQKGYRAGERLLRPATVVVASAPPVPSPVASRPDQERSAEHRVVAAGHGHRHHGR
jgi:molecular chaperone GrpE